MDPKELAEKIFTKELKDAKSYALRLDEDDTLTVLELFEFLLMVFNYGMKILFGDDDGKVDLANVSDEDFEIVNRYYNSFYFKCMYVVYPIETTQHVDFNKLSYKNVKITKETRLSDLALPIMVKEKVFVIGFDKL